MLQRAKKLKTVNPYKSVPNDPVEDEADDAVQEGLRDENEQSEAAECAAGHLVVLVLAMPEKQINNY